MQISNNSLTLGISFLLSLLLLVSCSRKSHFEKSVVVPSASGRVKVKKDNNNNYSMFIKVRDLTVPGNLVPAKRVYVVWNEAGNGVFNIGQLVSSRSFLKRGFTADMEAVSPNKPRRIFITAEDDKNVQSPGTQVVLTTPDNF